MLEFLLRRLITRGFRVYFHVFSISCILFSRFFWSPQNISVFFSNLFWCYSLFCVFQIKLESPGLVENRYFGSLNLCFRFFVCCDDRLQDLS